MAEALLRNELKDTPQARSARISSAGLHAIPGNAAHTWALASSREFGISLEEHRAQLLTAEMVQEADVIFAMDFQNQAELLTLYPDSRHKVFMLGACLQSPSRCREIPDPFFGDVETTRNCYRVLQTCVRNLAAELFPRTNQ
jgi:protein-tyrosine phosphatase